MDSSQVFFTVLNFVGKFFREMKSIISPLDSWALRLQSPATSVLLLTGFGLIISGWFGKVQPQCYDPSNKLKPLNDSMRRDICQVYSSGEFSHRYGDPVETKEIVYRWVPPLLVVLAVISHLPQMIRGRLEMPKLTQAMRDILHSPEGEKSRDYIRENLGGHGGQLKASLLVSASCLFANFVSVLLIDMALKNTFFTIPMHFPFPRGWGNRSDYLELFPLTTKCVINYGWNIQVYGCEFPMNMYYSKLFICLFVWYCFTTACTVLSIVMKVLQLFSCCRRKETPEIRQKLDVINKSASRNDMWILAKLRKFADDEVFAGYLDQALGVLQSLHLPEEVVSEEHLSEEDKVQGLGNTVVDYSSLHEIVVV
ncbi:innexin shaking-B-like [Macrobrachium rosenbergii]|uniref:innexin shaking-B-like n=1 Tax=Macrobrachium rosenbergii TaxID=79674 RepID=UPI0034D7A110